MANYPSKLNKYHAIRQNRALIPYLPITSRLTAQSLSAFLNRHGSVVIKPLWGSNGNGVISIRSKKSRRAYEVHYRKHKKVYSNLDSLYTGLKKMTKNKQYLIQRKIDLAQINGRPFDLRVMIQRSKQKGWVVTGKLVKLASPGYFVTNLGRNEGKVIPLHTAIQRSNIRNISVSKLEKQIDHVVSASVRRLQTQYPIRTVGFDIGLDRRGHIWIIEPNYTPDKTMFQKLKDKSIYRRIMKYYNQKR